MLACTEAITVVRCDGEGYRTFAIAGVSWYDKTRVRAEGTGLAFDSAVLIRIPAAAIAPDTVLPEVGDHVFRGLLPAGKTIEGPADLAARCARKVMAVGDNRRGRPPHVAVMGK